MTSMEIGTLILLGSFILFVMMRIPVCYSLIGSSVLTCLYLKLPVMVIWQRLTTGVQSFSLLAVPFFGTVFLWLDGACNYLWGTALALTPLLILKSEREGGFFDAGCSRLTGNCAKKRAASTERLDLAKRFGSGSGHGPLLL